MAKNDFGDWGIPMHIQGGEDKIADNTINPAVGKKFFDFGFEPRVVIFTDGIGIRGK